MTSIDHANLSRLDLNLLVAFDALLTERSVTRAAARIGLGQSAMSHNLARLRTLFGDELLTRGAEGMRPTPRALALADPVRITLAQIQAAVLQREAFDPSTADRAFRIGLADSIEVAVIPGLLARLRRIAPSVSLRLRSINRISVLEELDSGKLDLGIGVFDQGQMHHKRRLLYTDNFLCLFNPEQTHFSPPIALDDYLSVPHVLTSLTEDDHGASTTPWRSTS
jgi:DNA-binding transcriptional LysR family regulator